MVLVTHRVGNHEGERVTMDFVIESTTEEVQQAIYHNATDKPASVQIWYPNNPTPREFILDPMTDRTIDVPKGQRPRLSSAEVRTNWPAAVAPASRRGDPDE